MQDITIGSWWLDKDPRNKKERKIRVTAQLRPQKGVKQTAMYRCTVFIDGTVQQRSTDVSSKTLLTRYTRQD